jgi:hypothetical protein
MRVAAGGLEYTWVDNWGQLPLSPRRHAGWAHHGIVAARNGEVVTFDAADPTVLVFSSAGILVGSWSAPVIEAHGMALSTEGQHEYLWIADPGAKRTPATGYQYEPAERRGQAIKFSLDGRVLQRLEKPALPLYAAGTYSPTSVTVFEKRHGGNGDVWVADGYGESLVHRYSESGELLGSISGVEGAGRFRCPHAVFVDTRKREPELYVADRGNRRVQVYDLDGRFKREFGAEFLSSPSAFAVTGEMLVVAELRGRLAVVDSSDRLSGYLGADPRIADIEAGGPQDIPGWPNRRGLDGAPARPGDLAPGKFNSPHGIAADAAGDLYVVEWLIGGRFTRLVRR